MRKSVILKILLAIFLVASFFFVSLYYPNPHYDLTALRFSVIRVVDKPFNSYTEGLVFFNGVLFESSGGDGNSAIYSYLPGSNDYSAFAIGNKYFGEGIALANGALHVLTWKHGVALRFSLDKKMSPEKLYYAGEGWGLTNTGSLFVRSDGSSQLHFHVHKDFSPHHSVPVTDSAGRLIDRLNELEYVDGYIWANRWHDTRVYKINAVTGVAVGFVDLKEICERVGLLGENVLNGIAWDSVTKGFWITGKDWDKSYLIKVF